MVGGGGWVGGDAQFDGFLSDVHAYLEVEVGDEGRVDFGPGLFERGEAVRWDGDLAVGEFSEGCGGDGSTAGGGRGEDGCVGGR